VRATNEPVRAGADWLALREPADATARSTELADELASLLPSGSLEIHDLGAGTGSMARWLAPRLARPQRWVLHDRDADLLARAGDGFEATIETRVGDITRLDPGELAGADLIVASGLLDMLTAAELDRMVTACARVGCPALVTLSVVGRVELHPADPFDRRVTDAFNAHQRRDLGAGRLLGPDAARAAAEAFSRHGYDVTVRPSPWRLGPEHTALQADWFAGWLGAACEQEPALRDAADAYARRRRTQMTAGTLSVTVHQQDLLARPAPRSLDDTAWPGLRRSGFGYRSVRRP
jgi:hypothetical protein